jgi:hypothetical protein
MVFIFRAAIWSPPRVSVSLLNSPFMSYIVLFHLFVSSSSLSCLFISWVHSIICILFDFTDVFMYIFHLTVIILKFKNWDFFFPFAIYQILCCENNLLFFFCSTGFWTQGLHLVMVFFFRDRVSTIFPGWL